MMRRGFRQGFQGFPGRYQGNRGRGRGSRGRGGLTNSHFHHKDSSDTVHALQVAEGHQCNYLSFDTKDPATADKRIYVSNLCRTNVTRSSVYVIFSKYGTITAISHLSCRNPRDYCCFAFVQFTTREAAEKAVKSENGHGYYGYALG